jgi:DNA polymerase III alpha subunit (gram-positive type)
MIKLKDILAEAKLYSFTIPEVLDKFLKFDGKTMVLFDTETVGLEPNTSYIQVTHIAAMAYDGSTFNEVGEYSKKVNIGPELDRALNDPNSPEAKHLGAERARHEKKYKKTDLHPRDALKMTGYDTPNAEKLDEKEALIQFEKFLGQFPNAIILAHNATFDMKVIAARRKFHGLPPMKRYPVLDTLQVARYFFIPAMQSLESVPEVKNMLDGLLAKTKYKSYSSSLGKLGAVLGVKVDGWHDAKEDVKMLMQVLHKIITFLKTNPSADIKKFQSTAAKRFRKSKF